MGNDHVTTIRIPTDLAQELELVARVEEKSVSEVMREALAEAIEKRRSDSEFCHRLRERVEADRAILERLAGDTNGSSEARA